ncbi:MAG: Calx-beta domain-containing protein [Flavisolibacter sp.]
MKLYFLLALLGCALIGYGQDGTLDPAFASKGWTGFSYGNLRNINNEDAKQALTQSDGKVILVLDVNGGTRLTRYNIDGSRDLTFGMNGFSVSASLAPVKAVQTGSKIVVAGYTNNTGSSDVALFRFKVDGTADSSFGSFGFVSTSFSSNNDRAFGLAVQNDGRIVVAGTTEQIFEHSYLLVTRYTVDGSPDSSFGQDGSTMVITDVGGDAETNGAVAIQGDGKIVVAGGASDLSGNMDFVLVRYLMNGTPDSAFGTNGIVMTDFGAVEGATSIVMQKGSKEKILVAGYSFSADPLFGNVALARYTLTGQLDNSFGTGGKVSANPGYDMMTSCMALQRVGGADKIVVGGISETGFAAARFSATGVLDNTFGTGGGVTTDFGTTAFANCLAIQTDGKIVLAGQVDFDRTRDYGLVRYTANGALDNTYGGGNSGKVVGFYVDRVPGFVTDIIMQADGKVIAGGTTQYGNNVDFVLARYNTDGSIDNGFGTDGFASVTISADTAQASEKLTIALQSNGAIVVASSARFKGSRLDFVVARFTAGGIVDSSFGTNGIAVADVGAGDLAQRVIVQTISGEERIVVAGQNESGFEHSDIVLLRYNNAGVLDNGFGTGGIFVSNYPYDLQVSSAAIQRTGAEDKILVTAYYKTPIIVRYNSNGTVDSPFGTDGIVTTDLDNSVGMGNDIFVQADSKIIIAGSKFGTSYDMGLQRYNADGSKDLGFGTNGLVTTDFAGQDDILFSAVVQGDGKIVGMGADIYANEKVVIELARYTSSGVPDLTFGTAGKTTATLDYPALGVSAAWSNERLYTGGMMMFDGSAGFVAAFKASSATYMNINNVTVYESVNGTQNNIANLLVSLSRPASAPITVNYATQDISAVSKGKTADYRAVKGSVVIPKGESSAAISITIYADNITEGDETFNVNLSLTSQMAKLATIVDGTGEVTIKDGTGSIAEGSSERLKTAGPAVMNGKLNVKAYPNPSEGEFTLLVQSGASEPVNVVITDVNGRIIEKRMGVQGNIKIGGGYEPGVYYVQVMQGKEKVVLKLMKQGK